MKLEPENFELLKSDSALIKIAGESFICWQTPPDEFIPPKCLKMMAVILYWVDMSNTTLLWEIRMSTRKTVKLPVQYSTRAAGVYESSAEQDESARIYGALTHLLI